MKKGLSTVSGVEQSDMLLSPSFVDTSIAKDFKYVSTEGKQSIGC
jgi:hypothetical protein